MRYIVAYIRQIGEGGKGWSGGCWTSQPHPIGDLCRGGEQCDGTVEGWRGGGSRGDLPEADPVSGSGGGYAGGVSLGAIAAVAVIFTYQKLRSYKGTNESISSKGRSANSPIVSMVAWTARP